LPLKTLIVHMSRISCSLFAAGARRTHPA